MTRGDFKNLAKDVEALDVLHERYGATDAYDALRQQIIATRITLTEKLNLMDSFDPVDPERRNEPDDMDARIFRLSGPDFLVVFGNESYRDFTICEIEEFPCL